MSEQYDAHPDGQVESAAPVDDRERIKAAINETLANKVAAKATENVVAKSIKHLQSLRSDLAGEDSGLGTVWLEYCAQVQGERSYAWEHYEDLVLYAVRVAVQELAAFELQAAWLGTPEGTEWLDAPDSDPSQVPASVDDVANEIYGNVWQRASDWEDPRLERYLCGDENDDAGDEDEDDDEFDNDEDDQG